MDAEFFHLLGYSIGQSIRIVLVDALEFNENNVATRVSRTDEKLLLNGTPRHIFLTYNSESYG